MLLCYLDARDVAARLDRVVGPAGWRVSYEPWQGGSLCTLSLRCPETGEWVSKQDVGTGNQFEKVKGACSDALKRAAAAWGIGRYLYAAPSPWVDVGSNGPIRVYYKDKGGQVLQGYCQRPQLPAAFTPDGWRKE